MRIESLFPGYEKASELIEGLPASWASLLNRLEKDQTATLVAALGLASDSSAATSLSSASREVALLAPISRRDRKRAYRWQCVVRSDDRVLLIFSNPHGLHETSGIPLWYARLLKDLGTISPGRYGGHTMTSDEIALTLRDHPRLAGHLPFYNHETGDFDCFGPDEFDVYTFDHETEQLRLTSTGGFSGWFGRQLNEVLGAPLFRSRG